MMSDKIKALLAATFLSVLLLWAGNVSFVTPVEAQTVSTANRAYPLPVNTSPWNTAMNMASTTYNTYSLTTNAAKSLSTVTGGYIPAGTKILRVLAASGAFHWGNSAVLTDTSGKYLHVAEDAYVDIPCDPLSPNSGSVYFCNAATDTGTLLRFIPLK